MVGLEWAGLVVDNPVTLVQLGDLHSPPVLLSLFGVLLISVLFALGIRGAILLGILVTAAVGLALDLIAFEGVVGVPSVEEPTFLKLDILGAYKTGGLMDFLAILFVFFFLDLFDTVGTLVGIGQRAGFLVDGKLPRAERALLSDAVGTVAGTALGTSTITSYIESAAGVSEGGRTGLANMVTAFLFILAIFFYPLARMVGGEVQYGGLHLYPVIAPPLIIVGSMMMTSVKSIQWDDYTESIPAFLTLIAMPLTFSITEGIAFGFISFALLKLLSGRGREVNAFIYVFAVLFVVRYAIKLA
jgi:AGZA family xanthine/uracil permease-like MFS transporter